MSPNLKLPAHYQHTHRQMFVVEFERSAFPRATGKLDSRSLCLCDTFDYARRMSSAGDGENCFFSKSGHRSGPPKVSQLKVKRALNHQRVVKLSDEFVGQFDNDLVIEDFEDDTLACSRSSVGRFERRQHFQGQPVASDTAVKLKAIVLGSALKVYPLEWMEQTFDCFHSTVKYGMIQKKGGPCGVLAAVQAFLLKALFHSEDSRDRTVQSCLATALSDILWKIKTVNKRTEAFLVVQSTVGRALPPTSSFKCDGITENLSFKDYTDPHQLLKDIQVVRDPQDSSSSLGIISFLYSCCLTRGLDEIRQDFDDPITASLIGSHNYCNQEMVNLMLTGRACSNVFNGNVTCDSLVLRGIAQQSEIGLLSLFEHYNSCEVGSHYKSPLCPIWLILSESHFSVLFSKDTERATNAFPLDVYYWDGLQAQEDEIKLTIKKGSTAKGHFALRERPPLELCIRTKWGQDIAVDWNSSVPIL